MLKRSGCRLANISVLTVNMANENPANDGYWRNLLHTAVPLDFLANSFNLIEKDIKCY